VAVTFADVDGPELARPVVDILEQVLVERLEMFRVVLARQHGPSDFDIPRADDLRFEIPQYLRVSDRQFVLQAVRTWNDVRVVTSS
jgi:hypothetical protein